MLQQLTLALIIICGTGKTLGGSTADSTLWTIERPVLYIYFNMAWIDTSVTHLQFSLPLSSRDVSTCHTAKHLPNATLSTKLIYTIENNVYIIIHKQLNMALSNLSLTYLLLHITFTWAYKAGWLSLIILCHHVIVLTHLSC